MALFNFDWKVSSMNTVKIGGAPVSRARGNASVVRSMATRRRLGD